MPVRRSPRSVPHTTHRLTPPALCIAGTTDRSILGSNYDGQKCAIPTRPRLRRAFETRALLAQSHLDPFRAGTNFGTALSISARSTGRSGS